MSLENKDQKGSPIGLISLIRKNGKIVVIIIATALAFFIAGQGITSLIPIISGTRNQFYAGEIAGQKIKFQDFDRVLNKQRSHQAKNIHDNKENHLQDEKELIEYIWSMFEKGMIETHMFKKEFDKLGIFVSQDELVDMVQGEHIHFYIRNIFVDPKTKKFDKNSLLEYLQLLPNKSKKEQTEWKYVEESLEKARYFDKLASLMSNSIYLTNVDLDNEAKYEYASRSLNILYIPYSSISDDAIEITDQMIKDYVDSHKENYKVEKGVDFIYVEFPIEASKIDEENVLKEIEKENILNKFKHETNSEAFAQTYSHSAENSINVIYDKDKLEKKFPEITRWKIGTLIGPKKENNIYKIYKLTKIERIKNKTKYHFVVIERHIEISEDTQNEISNKANEFLNNIKDKEQFKEEAEKQGLKVHLINQIRNDAFDIGNLRNSRGLVKWLYGKENKNKVSPLFLIDKKYIVGFPIKYTNKGVSEIEYIKDEVKEILLKQEKAKIINSKLNFNQDLTLKEIATAYGKEAKLLKIEKLKFSDEDLKDIGKIKKAVGKAFAIKNIGEKTKPFNDENGVLILELLHKEDSIDSKEMNKSIDINSESMLESYNIFVALKDKSNIKKNIYKFY